METSEKAQFEILYGKYLVWKSSQVAQNDGYEFEKSFAELCKEFNSELFKLSIEGVSDKKKGYYMLWRSNGKKGALSV